MTDSMTDGAAIKEWLLTESADAVDGVCNEGLHDLSFYNREELEAFYRASQTSLRAVEAALELASLTIMGMASTQSYGLIRAVPYKHILPPKPPPPPPVDHQEK